MKRNRHKNTGAGRYKQMRQSSESNSNPSTRNNPVNVPEPDQDIAKVANRFFQTARENNVEEETITDGERFLLQLKNEWESRQINTESLDKLLGIINALKREEGIEYVRNLMNTIKNLARKLPWKGVMNIMSDKLNLDELLQNLGSNDQAADLVKSMMNDPSTRQQAMDMMKQMMDDEEQFKQMTELMTKMFQSDK
ncbi:hypothetical protein SAMN05216389_101255 [Oceanobacillus limi]|uniref:Uncharacterized protein n=1 Tax=Oceanobacillus limi TaxID=930131 RepID=A0A1H9Y8H8_9BACI|nr:hypothetical protein [Oceanobacillus limi]SES65129.1 hypothetical protein SAMN05216389_101255 [Oceanobacillus limi]